MALDNIYVYLIIILMATAVVDLIVGVGNDAVNFLNSAIGSKVASFKFILIVASLGVVIGCTFSSGMMEVARNGLFNPSFFTFDRVMVVFMAVMLTDIILLDIYNTFGLPTSTTVSLVFEILGAALITGYLLSYDKTGTIPDFHDVINTSSAITIISGIFLSVFISFIVSTVVQHIVRIVFTFDLEESLKKYGAIFSGISISVITYFLLIKGAKGSVFISADQEAWISRHTSDIMLVSVVLWSIVIQMLMWWVRINPLKIIVLLGTFSLAMAFAANDLVNFVGVPVAGLISYQKWMLSGLAATDYNMVILASKVETPYWILLICGGIMILTLWTNAKARKVTETEVSLGRQDEGDEKFRPNFLSRAMVGLAVSTGQLIDSMVPKKWSDAMSLRFMKKKESKPAPETVSTSFDLVRASVNLIVSSVLIAYGTANKLPLSTTFVTFMVAMGSSFADQAWGRESAVYRVAGVINVIASWFLTAAIAFTGAGFIAFILYLTGTTGFFVLAGLATFFLVRSHIVFQKRARQEQIENKAYTTERMDARQVMEQSKEATLKTFKAIKRILQHSVHALENEKQGTISKAREEIQKLKAQNEKLHTKIIKQVRKMDQGQLAAGRLYILVFDNSQDLYQSASVVCDVCTDHVINHHPKPNNYFLKNLKEVESQLQNFIDACLLSLEKNDLAAMRGIKEREVQIEEIISRHLDREINDIQTGVLSSRMGLLQTRLYLELQDILEHTGYILQLYLQYDSPPTAKP